jgi:hypothetical protein
MDIIDSLRAQGADAFAKHYSLGTFKLCADAADEIERARADVAFLLARAAEAGACKFYGERWVGMSSNSIVSVAYGGEQTDMPSDRGDYASCVRTVRRLPRHRRTPAVIAALRAAKGAYRTRYPKAKPEDTP